MVVPFIDFCGKHALEAPLNGPCGALPASGHHPTEFDVIAQARSVTTLEAAFISGAEHETHLSTFPSGPQTPSRFPFAHGDAGRSQSDRGAPRPRSQETVGLIAIALVLSGTGDVIQTLKKRPDFLAVRKGRRLRGPFFVVDALHRDGGEQVPRVGFTVTKAQGNAVERNRMKRQLRALARTHPELLTPSTDYVLTGHRDMLNTPYATLKAEYERRMRAAQDGTARPARPKATRSTGMSQPARD